MRKLPLKHKDTSPRGITQFLRYLLNLKDIQRGKQNKIIKSSSPRWIFVEEFKWVKLENYPTG